MSTSYSATAEFTDSQTVLVDGDAASADNLNAAPKKALDRCAMLRAATDGLLVWRNTARVATGGAASGTGTTETSAAGAVGRPGRPSACYDRDRHRVERGHHGAGRQGCTGRPGGTAGAARTCGLLAP